jgi:transformer-2 protein
MSHTDPYADFPAAGQTTAAAPSQEMNDAPRGRSRSRSPLRNGGSSYHSPRDRSPRGYRRRSPAPRKPNHAPTACHLNFTRVFTDNKIISDGYL